MTAERETPAGEAMREAVARHINPSAYNDREEPGGYMRKCWDEAIAEADALLAGPIASELARLTAERDDAEQRVTNLANALTSAHRARGAQEKRADEADDRRVTLEKDRIHPAFSVEVQEHRQQAYESGWSDGYAEGAAKARSAAEAALTTQRAEHAAEVARKDAEIARLKDAVRVAWTRFTDIAAGKAFQPRLHAATGATEARAALANPETNDA